MLILVAYCKGIESVRCTSAVRCTKSWIGVFLCYFFVIRTKETVNEKSVNIEWQKNMYLAKIKKMDTIIFSRIAAK